MKPFGYLVQTTSAQNPPHGWAFFFDRGGAPLPDDVSVFLQPSIDQLEHQIRILTGALRIIAGEDQCVDNTLGNVEIARLALKAVRELEQK